MLVISGRDRRLTESHLLANLRADTAAASSTSSAAAASSTASPAFGESAISTGKLFSLLERAI
jgi:hypothetical protein